MPEKLKRCPFCKGESRVVHLLDPAPIYEGWKVECQKCGAQTQRHICQRDALAAWNKRSGRNETIEECKTAIEMADDLQDAHDIISALKED